jgi:hypothetical protein
VRFGDFSLVLLDRFDVALDHAARLWVQGRGARLVYFQAFQNLMYQTGLEVTALFTMQFSRYSKTAEVGNQRFRYCRSLLIKNGVGFRL